MMDALREWTAERARLETRIRALERDLAEERNARKDADAEVDDLRAACRRNAADKAEMVRRNKMLRDRPDLPADRTRAADEYEQHIAELRAELKWVYAKLYSAHKDLQDAGLPISNVTYMRRISGGEEQRDG